MRALLVALIVVVAAAVALQWWRTERMAAGVSEPPLPPPAASPAPRGEASPPAPRETLPAPAAEEAAPAAPPPVFDINSEGDLLLALRELGLEDLDGKMAEWAVRRGYPEYDQMGNLLLDQPYQQYDDETLRGLAENDDMWAQQILAQRLEKQQPAEAVEWYRRAAVNGSVYAMTELARLYFRLSSRQLETALKGQGGALDQVYAIRDVTAPEVNAYAWVAAAEAAGWDPTRGASVASLVGRKLAEDQIADACELAQSIGGALRAERSARGLGDFDMTPPPIVYAPMDMGGSTQCYREEDAYELSACKEIVVRTGTVSTNVWVCDP